MTLYDKFNIFKSTSLASFLPDDMINEIGKKIFDQLEGDSKEYEFVSDAINNSLLWSMSEIDPDDFEEYIQDYDYDLDNDSDLDEVHQHLLSIMFNIDLNYGPIYQGLFRGDIYDISLKKFDEKYYPFLRILKMAYDKKDEFILKEFRDPTELTKIWCENSYNPRSGANTELYYIKEMLNIDVGINPKMQLFYDQMKPIYDEIHVHEQRI